MRNLRYGIWISNNKGVKLSGDVWLCSYVQFVLCWWNLNLAKMVLKCANEPEWILRRRIGHFFLRSSFFKFLNSDVWDIFFANVNRLSLNLESNESHLVVDSGRCFQYLSNSRLQSPLAFVGKIITLQLKAWIFSRLTFIWALKSQWKNPW